MTEKTHPAVYEEVPFADFEYVEDDQMYYYQCPCGDMFEISTVPMDIWKHQLLPISSCTSQRPGATPMPMYVPPAPHRISSPPAKPSHAAQAAHSLCVSSSIQRRHQQLFPARACDSRVRCRIMQRLSCRSRANMASRREPEPIYALVYGLL